MVPVVLMSLTNGILVPLGIEWLAEFKGEVCIPSYWTPDFLLTYDHRQMSHSAMNRSVVRYLYPFQVLQQFILFIVFGTVISKSRGINDASRGDLHPLVRNHRRGHQ